MIEKFLNFPIDHLRMLEYYFVIGHLTLPGMVSLQCSFHAILYFELFQYKGYLTQNKKVINSNWCILGFKWIISSFLFS